MPTASHIKRQCALESDERKKQRFPRLIVQDLAQQSIPMRMTRLGPESCLSGLPFMGTGLGFLPQLKASHACLKQYQTQSWLNCPELWRTQNRSHTFTDSWKARTLARWAPIIPQTRSFSISFPQSPGSHSVSYGRGCRERSRETKRQRDTKRDGETKSEIKRELYLERYLASRYHLRPR